MTNDPFETFDGAYVLGALSTADRSSFEAHLEVCDACMHRVAALWGVPRLLNLAAPDTADDDAPDLVPGVVPGVDRGHARTAAVGNDPLMATPAVSAHAPVPAGTSTSAPPPSEPALTPSEPALPSGLLPDLLDRVRRERRRRHVVARTVAGLVAACVLAVAGVVGFAVSHRPASGPQASNVPTATVANAFFAAQVSVTVTPQHAHDQVNLSCTYKSPRVISGNYLAVANDATGRSEVVASWPAIPGQTAVVHTPTTFKAGTITSVSILDARGDVLARVAV